MQFTEWLEQQMTERGLSQAEVSKRSKMAGHYIDQSTLSRIITGERNAGPEACIAIAAGLNLPREEVFRARGWLLNEPEVVIEPEMAPRTVGLARRVSSFPPAIREQLLDALEAVVATVHGVYQK